MAMNESEVRALVRDEMRILVGSMAEAADWYTCGYDDHTESAANLVKDVAARMASDLATEPVSNPEPVNPFAPVFPAKSWAEGIAILIRQAKNDGHEVWVSGNSEAGPMSLRVGVGSDAPVAFEEES